MEGREEGREGGREGGKGGREGERTQGKKRQSFLKLSVLVNSQCITSNPKRSTLKW